MTADRQRRRCGGRAKSRQLEQHLRRCVCCHLDDDALDHPGQPRHLVLRQDHLRPLRGHRGARGQLGQGRRDSTSSPTSSPPTSSPRPRSRPTSASPTSTPAELRGIAATIPSAASPAATSFAVPLLDGEHVTDDAGTGFVHTAPGHGLDDFEIWMASGRKLTERGIDTRIPYTVDDAGFYTKEAPGFDGARVHRRQRQEGRRQQARHRRARRARHDGRARPPQAPVPALVALEEADHLPQHAAVVRLHGQAHHGQSRRHAPRPRARRDRRDDILSARRPEPPPLDDRRAPRLGAQPPARLGRPHRRLRQRETGETLDRRGGQPPHRRPPSRTRAPTPGSSPAPPSASSATSYKVADYEKVDDILDVWFESGTTHSWVLRNKQKWPDLEFPAGMYLEGSDQHRGWFHSSLLESCATNGFAPYKSVLTHGFTLDGEGRKMSKSLGNTVAPQDIIKQYGADILRLWVASADYADDLRIGKEIINTTVDSYRKLRNTHALDARQPRALEAQRGRRLRGDARARAADAPPARRARCGRPRGLRRLRLQARRLDARQLHEPRALGVLLRHPQGRALLRPDQLGPPPRQPHRHQPPLRRADRLARPDPRLHDGRGLARAEPRARRVGPPAPVPGPARRPGATTRWPTKWEKIRTVRRVVTGALEIERKDKRIGSSLEAAPEVHIADADLLAALEGEDLAEIAITSDIAIREGQGPDDRLPPRRGRRRRGRSRARRGHALRPLVEDTRPTSAPTRNTPTSPPATPRRCASARPRGSPLEPGAHRAARPEPDPRRSSAFGLDRLHKLVQLEILGWTGGEFVPVTGFFDYVLVWNTGISYGLLGDVPFWALGASHRRGPHRPLRLVVARRSGLLRAGLALAIGGALSNAFDRWRYGAVADFFHFHWQNWSFYIFNLADAAITMGVLLLILDFVGIGRGKRSERIAA